MRRIQLYLDEDLDEAIARRAADQGVPKSVVIRGVLRTAFPAIGSAEDPSALLVGAYEGEEDESGIIDHVVSRA